MAGEVERIAQFYEAFQRKDGAAMAACYAPDVRFSDPVFPDLRGERAGEMWKMLTSRAADLEITFSDVSFDGTVGKAHWEARYTFSVTGNHVHNVIDATFRFAPDGRIAEHTDVFDFWRWSRQALGWKGWALGWTPIVKNAVRAQAAKGLDAWMAKRGA
jgi:ketosteroid isomerase-like protein